MCSLGPFVQGLSGITWGGWDNFFYLFTYEDTRDAFSIPHDIRILEEVSVLLFLLFRSDSFYAQLFLTPVHHSHSYPYS